MKDQFNVVFSIVRDGREIRLSDEEIFAVYQAVKEKAREIDRESYKTSIKTYLERHLSDFPDYRFRSEAGREEYVDCAARSVEDYVDEGYDIDSAILEACRGAAIMM